MNNILLIDVKNMAPSNFVHIRIGKKKIKHAVN